VSLANQAGRVIAGTARGTRLQAPGSATRPLGDRVKQTLFAILEPDLPGAHVLDLYAGSGAAGIEALSRGATHATFVERDRVALRAIAANLNGARLADRATIVAADVIAWLADTDLAASRPVSIVIVDPPYADPDLLLASLELVALRLPTGAQVVAKHFWRDQLPEQVGLLASARQRRFGDTALTFYRREENR
jgi:16S rRNA (guanine(966)-N(2))-methyltransferase RsmD